MTQLSSLQKLLVNVLEDKTVTLVDDNSETCNHWLKKNKKNTQACMQSLCQVCPHLDANRSHIVPDWLGSPANAAVTESIIIANN